MPLAPVFSRAYGKKILEHLGKKTELAMPTPWLAVLETEPTGALTGSTIKEGKWTGYKRVKVEGAAWKTATEGSTCEMTNTSAIEIPYTSGEGKVKWACLCDAETAGNVIVIGELNEEFLVKASASPLKFEAGEVKFTISSS